MTSKRTSEDTESSLTMEQQFLMDNKLASLSCPFTWGMENVIKYRNNLLASEDDRFKTVTDVQEDFPDFVLVWHLLLAYENTMIDKLENAMQSISEAEQSLADIKQQAALKNVENVLEHIFVATKCHVLKNQKKLLEMNELLEQIYEVDNTKISRTESAILNGFQCLAWYLYGTQESKEVTFAKKAVVCEPTNGKWYYLLGKSYRTYRRKYQSYHSKPSEDETLAFEQAYMLSKNLLFGISLACLHRESRNFEKANKIYKEIHHLQPTSCTIRLQLALGFIRARECELAKDCLDYVAERIPNSPIYNHYMGIYKEKCCNDLKAAVHYYEIAINDSNYAAEQQYIQCRKQVEPNWDPLPHLLDVLKKCEKDSDCITQEANVHIGTYYLLEKRDIPSACIYLKNAIEIQPKAQILKRHYLFFKQRVQVNIYDILTKEIQHALRFTVNYDRDTIAVLQNTLELCRQYYNGNSEGNLTLRRNRGSYQRRVKVRGKIDHQVNSNSKTQFQERKEDRVDNGSASHVSIQRGHGETIHQPTRSQPLAYRSFYMFSRTDLDRQWLDMKIRMWMTRNERFKRNSWQPLFIEIGSRKHIKAMLCKRLRSHWLVYRFTMTSLYINVMNGSCSE